MVLENLLVSGIFAFVLHTEILELSDQIVVVDDPVVNAAQLAHHSLVDPIFDFDGLLLDHLFKLSQHLQLVRLGLCSQISLELIDSVETFLGKLL